MKPYSFCERKARVAAFGAHGLRENGHLCWAVRVGTCGEAKSMAADLHRNAALCVHVLLWRF